MRTESESTEPNGRRPGRNRALSLALVLALFVPAASLATPARADVAAPAGKAEKKKKEEPKKTVDAASVYYGNATSKWARPAEIDLDTVYAEIPEYKTIVKDKLTADDARYEILMSKVCRKFQKAVKKAAKDGGYDLVAQVGAVQGVDDVPVITQSVIDAL